MVPANPIGQKRPTRTAEPRRQKAATRGLLGALCLAFGLPWAGFAAAEEGELKGPDIVIIAEEERTIFEFRQAGELRMVRVVPRIGKPYYLVPRDQTKGFGNLERADMLVPSWVIVEF